jgi:hypothetical protein
MTNKSERERWTGYVAHMGKIRNLYTLVVKPERRPLERPRHGWEDDIKMDLQEVGWQNVSLICLAQYEDQCRLVNTGFIKHHELLGCWFLRRSFLHGVTFILCLLYKETISNKISTINNYIYAMYQLLI